MHLQSVKYTPTPSAGRIGVSAGTGSRAHWLAQLSSNRRPENFTSVQPAQSCAWTTQSPPGQTESTSQALFGLPSRFARLKLAELTVIDLVETSVCAGQQAKVELALAKAREAQSAFESLKVALVREKSVSSMPAREDTESPQLVHSQPMSKGIRVAELSMMVASNLADQLRRNKLLDESLELYMQICKTTAASNLLFGSESETKCANIRFGLNVANVLAEMTNFSRAIKYYRITLDQINLSTQRNLRLKIMNNISVALVESKLLADAHTSFKLLLSDNLVLPEVRVTNGNHHSFGLNLAVCMYLRDERQALLAMLAELVKVGVCHHYERVLDCFSLSSELESQSESSRFASHVQQDTASQSESTKLASQSEEIVQLQAESNEQQVTRDAQHLVANQTLGSLKEDRLELLINRKHNQISNSILSTCNLIVDLNNRASTATKNDVSSDSSACLELIAASGAHQALVHDLTINDTCRMVSKCFKLDEAIARLRAIDQSADQAKPISKQLTTSQQAPRAHRFGSSLVYSNLCLLNMLLSCYERAKKLGHLAIKLDESNSKASVNLVSCYIRTQNYDIAEKLLDSNLPDDLACYNAITLESKLQRGQEIFRPPLTSVINRYQNNPPDGSKLKSIDLMLITRVVLILSERKKYQQSLNLLNNLIPYKSRDYPELHLLASRIRQQISTKLEASATSSLKLVQKEHRYLNPLNERIVALSIASFDYKEAESLLLECITNRPQQVKWYQMLAESLWRATDYNSAISIYKITLDIFPCNISSLKALIKMLGELGLSAEMRKFEERYDKLMSSQ